MGIKGWVRSLDKASGQKALDQVARWEAAADAALSARQFGEAARQATAAVEVLRRGVKQTPALAPRLARALLVVSAARLGEGRDDKARAPLAEADHLVPGPPDSAYHAQVLMMLADAHQAVGDRYRALVRYRDAVEMSRRLGAPGDLAAQLIVLAVRLSQLKRLDEAIVTITESVAILRRVVTDDPGRHEPHLALALTELCAWLPTPDRVDEAVVAVREAVELRRRLAPLAPNDLAVSLTTLATTLGEQNPGSDEALASAREAVRIVRAIADAGVADTGEPVGKAMVDRALVTLRRASGDLD